MILFRKGAPLRIRRSAAPEPPYWCATNVASYAARRATPVAIDYLALRASGTERLEVGVADNVADELSRTKALADPLLIDAAESAESIFRRGDDVLAFCEEQRLGALYLTSTRGALPQRQYEHAVTAIAAWPLDLEVLRGRFAEAREKRLRWGVVVPLLFPVTTDLEALDALSREIEGAAFFCGVQVDAEATARQAIAQAMQLAGDDDRYAMLFHSRLEPIQLATERHIAALAAERGVADFVVPPRWEERSNWNAAVLLTRTASRMMAMELDLDLAGFIARSARVVAELDKPLARIAESASLSIVGGLDETSAGMLSEWLAGEGPSFATFVDEQWRLRRG